MTIYDISKQAGVSIATVSRVLNGSANVKPKTRKKVLEVMEQCGYTPNAFARGLGLDSMNTVGILCADSSDLYLAKAVYFIEKNLRAGGYHSILCCTGYEQENMKASLSLLLEQRVDSVIMVGSAFIEEDGDNQYIRNAAAQVPVMLLNADLDCPNVYCTMCDDFKAAQEATMFLFSQGITDILYLYNSTSYSGRKKLSGYQSAYLMKDIPLNKQYQQFFPGSHEDIDGVCQFLNELRKKGLAFHAVLSAEDMLAAGAIKYARINNLSVPEDLSVIGYNNSLLCICCEPELSSIDNHLETLCSQLVKTCIGILSGEEMPQKTIFSGELIKRSSTTTKL
ncbi:MAG: LacI family transcriptional regulator [Lachnospiraceae bacterium]|nr:LacI family transcriptional regulator [Lachnospiraceae bacterium]MDE6977258.1 LacI family transcriptional regulator [Lachnospiraceae bacterium]